MSDRQPKHKPQRSEDVADLFKVLRFMGSDPDVSEAHFRIAFIVSQFVRASTGWAVVGDDALRDWLPRTDSKKLRLFRRAMEASNWMRIIEGERGRPTRYLFLDTRIPEIRKRLDEAAAKREAEFALSKSRDQSGAKAAALRTRIDAETGEIQPGITGQYDPLIEPSKAGNLCLNKGAILPPLLPQRSTSTEGYREKDETPGARASALTPAPMPARADVPRCQCGKPAAIEVGGWSDGPLIRQCAECHEEDDRIWCEVRPIAANDPSADYRRVRDGS